MFSYLDPFRDILSTELVDKLNKIQERFSFETWTEFSREEKDKNRKLIHKGLLVKVMNLKSKFPDLIKTALRDYPKLDDVFD